MSALRGLSDTFAFHASPEAFLQSQVESRRDGEWPLRSHRKPVIQTKLLNRNVAIVSSYEDIQRILRGPWNDSGQTDDGHRSSPCSAADAYAMFMAPFFPGPNLLLSEGAVHARMRAAWEQQLANGSSASQFRNLVQGLVTRHFSGLAGSSSSSSSSSSTVDLYASLKSLSWKILLGCFLGLQDSDAALASTIQALQEDLLRGQFSLFPVALNVGFWKSPRQRGLDAKIHLRRLIAERLAQPGQPWHLMSATEESQTEQNQDLLEVANHALLFTSSLAVKALASLMTAFLLNLFVFTRVDVRPCDELAQMSNRDRSDMLRSMQLETERLSPPIVGIMRRVVREEGIHLSEEQAPLTSIPKGWDVWLYFVGGGRDKSAFGGDAEHFVPHRFCRTEDKKPQSLAFSTGRKTCLGQSLVRELCIIMAETLLDMDIRISGSVQDRGARAWLGWEVEATAEDWARGMQQLPVQHPQSPIMVGVEIKGIAH